MKLFKNPKNKRNFFIALFAIVAIVGSLFFGQISDYFQASVLQVSKITPFDGTVFPVQKVPNWFGAGGSYGNTRTYDEFADSELMPIPDYDPSLLALSASTLGYSGSDLDVRNMKMVYTVLYLGTYNMDYIEGNGYHPAVDIIMPIGTPVRAIANGEVVKVQELTTGFGKHIVIGHPNVPDPENPGQTTNLYSSYSHLNEVDVKVGDIVNKGDFIGYSGETGTATAPHIHFQLDREDAPFMPYWPTGNSGALAAQYTSNPMTFVQDNLDNTSNLLAVETSGLHASAGNTDTNNNSTSTNNGTTTTTPVNNGSTTVIDEPVLASFELIYESTRVKVGENVQLIVRAIDSDGAFMDDFNDSVTLKAITQDNVVEYTLVFVDGEASTTVTVPAGATTFKLKVQDGSVEDSQTFTVEESTSNYNYRLAFTDPYVLEGETVRLKISAEKGGAVDPNYRAITPIVLDTEDGLSLSASTLSADDFIDGIATVYVEGSKEGSYEITAEAGDKEFTSDSLKVVGQVAPAASFEVSHDGFYVPGQPEQITVYCLDADGDRSPVYGYTVNLNLTDSPAGGQFSKTVLTPQDFDSGVATFTYTRSDAQDATITVGQGGLQGTSKRIEVNNNLNYLFSDVPGTHENIEAINYLYDQGVIKGYEDGTFKPNQTVSRVEALKMIFEAFNISMTPLSEMEFSDTYDDQWYAKYVERALAMGVVQGYDDGTFKPSQTVNRAEFMKLLFETNDTPVPYLDQLTEDPYPDVDKDQWFAGYATYAAERNIFPTDEKGNLNPAEGMSRAEVAEVLYRMMVLDQTGASTYTDELSI